MHGGHEWDLLLKKACCHDGRCCRPGRRSRGAYRQNNRRLRYDDFCHANDPHEEHDFGSFEVDGHTIFFKIDYYDSTLTVHSPDPSDPAVTKRVITIRS
jgi:hypothetical protein